MSGDGNASAARERPLDVVGIGSMVVDRMHRTARLLGADAKGMLRETSPGRLVERRVGGVVLNHLGWAAALGLRCGIFGRQGDDDDGRFLRAAMDRAGIARDLLLTGEPSSVAEIFVDDAGGRAIYMAAGATAATTAAQVREQHAPFIERAARLTTEVSQLPLAAALEALRIASRAGAETIVDLDVPPSDAVATLGSREELEAVLRAAAILKPSKGAAAELAGGEGRGAPPALELAQALRARFGCRAVVITDGERGCAISADDFEGQVAAASGVRVVDTTGAGDAFLGGLLAALRLGLDWKSTALIANAAGAACVGQLGAFPTNALSARARVLELCELVELPLPAPRGREAPGVQTEAGGRDPAVSTAAGSLVADATGLARDARAAAAVDVLDAARDGLVALRERALPGDFDRAASLVEAARRRGGRVHTLGVGKAGHVARYAAALLSSTGTPATAVDVLELAHGSAGQVERGDLALAVSHSGTTSEMLQAIRVLRARGARLVAVVGRRDSMLARAADAVLDASVAREGGPLELAPRASVVAELAMCAALAAELQARCGQSCADYAEVHPAGELGRRARGELD